jgi:Methyltransferase domain
MSDTTGARRFSPSTSSGLPLSRKLDEGVQLFQLYRREARAGIAFATLFDEIEEYDELLQRHSGIPLDRASVFEVGFGARPHRQVAMQSMGFDVCGVDVEAPVVPGQPSQFVEMMRRNGIERAMKSLVRHALFDRGERRALDRALRARGLARRLDPERLIVADATTLKLPPGSIDLVISEDVFEHIERGPLARIVERMAGWLRPGGLALVRPNVFTGITGGHLIGWSRRALRNPPDERQSEPWEHLRKRRFEPNTYLNELTRADYRALFSSHFEILEERVAQPDLGREHLDERARAELSEWPEEELFSNQTLFVLRPAPSGAMA